MTVKQLMELLSELDPNAHVYLDDDGYPSIDGAYSPEDFGGDEEDAPPENAVLLEFSSRDKE